MNRLETDQRYYRFQLWPHKRETGQRQVRQVLSEADEARLAPAPFAKDSVAVQGLSALELLLFPEAEVSLGDFSVDGRPSFRCRFALAIADNLAAMAAGTLADWTQGEPPIARPSSSQGRPKVQARPVLPMTGRSAPSCLRP